MDTLLQYGLVAVLVALLLAPLGLPVPEEISLLVAGILAGTDHATPAGALAVGYIGVVAGDLIAFTLGRRVGLHPTGFLARLGGADRIENLERFYRRWGNWAILIARQFPGMRFPAFFFAGATGVPVTRFLSLDGSGALITVGVYTWLGYAFADDISRVLPWVDRFRSIAAVVAIGVIGTVLWRILQRRRHH